MSIPLPSRASLEQLKNSAKDLARAYRAADPDAECRVHEYLPRSAALGACTFKLSQAQFVIAREHGFPSWPKLNDFLESRDKDPTVLRRSFKSAVLDGDAVMLRKLLSSNSLLRREIDEPRFPFDSTALVHAASRKDRATADVLLDFGANPDARSFWWAGGFGALPYDDPDLANHLIARGAHMSVHDASGLGRLEEMIRILDDNPSLISARGANGQTPLHAASNIDVAGALLERGAELDAVDFYHGSTPAQHMLVNRQNVCRYLIERGAAVDIFMAVRLGDVAMVRRLLAENPGCVTNSCCTAASTDPPGGHIYSTILESFESPLRLAAELGCWEIFDLICPYTSPREQLIACCSAGAAHRAEELARNNPGLAGALTENDRKALLDAAWKRKIEAVQVMLSLGFDLEAKGETEATALGRAASRGYADIVEISVAAGANVHARDNCWRVPLQNALSACTQPSEPGSDYPGVVQRLLDAGTSAD